MGKGVYETITGRRFDLASRARQERRFLLAVRKKYRAGGRWTPFSAWWTVELAKVKLSEKSVSYRICQDLEARLGIAEGKVAAPDYRDYLADLIEEEFGSRYRFCKETGVDPGHLSRVFASQSDLSLEALGKILKSLKAVLVVQGERELREGASPKEACRALAGVRL